MAIYIIRRTIQSLIVCFMTTIVVFAGVMLIGDPIELLITEDCDAACEAAARQALGMNRPIVEQYFRFVGDLLTGNLGVSFTFGTPVGELLLQRLPATLELALATMVITIAVGIPLGLLAGLKPDSRTSRIIMSGSILGFSVPSFWVGIVLIWLFSIELGWIPTIGRGETAVLFGVESSLFTLNGWAHISLPACNLALTQTALLIRLTASGVQENMTSDYIRFARAQGLTERRILLAHLMRNILVPIITVLGLEFGTLLAYSLVTETVFAWPGLGKLLIDSINLLDRPVIVTYLTITVLVFITINLIVDIGYAIVDPRVRLYKN